MRTGIGFDVHALVEGRPLILGGVKIPFDLGLAGHSDADVLTHAIMDAMLSAARLDDIGSHFPDTDQSWSGADSIELLRRVAGMLERDAWTIVDIDSVLVLELPKVAPYRREMREKIAGALGLDVENVGVKATTTEGLGLTGRGEGVAAYAVVLLERAQQ
jgi:2-C-methyl-D-erythritol 2,4-cyclodiphosphate synthase